MSAFQLRDLSRVQWGASTWLAILRGVASAVVLLPFEYAYQQDLVGPPSIVGAASFIALWVVGHVIAPLMVLLLKGVEGLFNLFTGRLGTLIAGINLLLLSLFFACGDPILFLIRLVFPRFVPVQKFNFINFTPYIFVLRDESVERRSDESEPVLRAETDHRSSVASQSAGYPVQEERERRPRGSALAIFLIAVAVGAVGAGVYLAQNGGLFASATAPTDSGPNAFSVRPYSAGEVLLARETGSRFRELPFARPDIRVLGETTEGERLTITGWVEQPEGHWYQVRLQDGRTAYLKGTLTTTETTAIREAEARRASITDFQTTVLRATDVRTGPGLEYETYSRVELGETVYVSSALRNWCMVNTAESQWVPCDALAPPPDGWIVGQTVRETCWPNCGD